MVEGFVLCSEGFLVLLLVANGFLNGLNVDGRLDRSPVLQMAHIVPKNSRQRVSNKMRGPVTLISNSPRLGSALRTEVHCSSWFSYRWARKVWLELGTDYR